MGHAHKIRCCRGFVGFENASAGRSMPPPSSQLRNIARASDARPRVSGPRRPFSASWQLTYLKTVAGICWRLVPIGHKLLPIPLNPGLTSPAKSTGGEKIPMGRGSEFFILMAGSLPEIRRVHDQVLTQRQFRGERMSRKNIHSLPAWQNLRWPQCKPCTKWNDFRPKFPGEIQPPLAHPAPQPLGLPGRQFFGFRHHNGLPFQADLGGIFPECVDTLRAKWLRRFRPKHPAFVHATTMADFKSAKVSF